MTWIGDGGTSTGVFHEGLNLAAVQKAPLVLIVDEDKKTATITGISEAQDKKLKVFPLEPAPK